MLPIHLDLFNKLPKTILARYADTERFHFPTWYLQSQHEELKKQHADLEEDHRKQGEEFSRTFSDHKERYLQLQQEKEQEISKLKGKCNLYLAVHIKMCICHCVLCDVRQKGIISVLTNGSFMHLIPPDDKLHFLDDFLWPLSEFICALRVSI